MFDLKPCIFRSEFGTNLAGYSLEPLELAGGDDMKLRTTTKPLHESRAERIRRVCGRSFVDREFSHPVILGFGLLVLVLCIVVIGVLAMSLMESMAQPYGERILEMLPGLRQ